MVTTSNKIISDKRDVVKPTYLLADDQGSTGVLRVIVHNMDMYPEPTKTCHFNKLFLTLLG